MEKLWTKCAPDFFLILVSNQKQPLLEIVLKIRYIGRWLPKSLENIFFFQTQSLLTDNIM